MNPHLKRDQENLRKILQQALAEADRFLQSVNQRSPGTDPTLMEPLTLPEAGVGTEQALARFNERYSQTLTGSAGPRYFGFVTGGATPASLLGDWLVSAFDQNAAGFDSPAALVETETIQFLKQLFDLPDTFSGAFVTGATVSNFVGLAIGRQWLGRQHGRDVAGDGWAGLPPLKVLSGTPHSSVFKALAMLGLGRNNLEKLPCLPEREAVDVAALRRRLSELEGEPCLVVANAGTVNTVDFDDLRQIAGLKAEFDFWLHVDGAFGGFAAVSPRYQHLVAGLEQADSLTIDAHKWLNVPYDAAMIFTRHKNLQLEVFQDRAVYLGELTANPDFFHLVPENSRRFRALPAWFTLMAYGRAGHQEIVERNCELARQLGEKIETSSEFVLLAPTRMNVVCFTLAVSPESLSMALIDAFLAKLRDDGRAFLTRTNYKGTPAIRAAISNWRTTTEDIDIAWQALQDVVGRFSR